MRFVRPKNSQIFLFSESPDVIRKKRSLLQYFRPIFLLRMMCHLAFFRMCVLLHRTEKNVNDVVRKTEKFLRFLGDISEKYVR